jgi:hypothetical protein
VSLSPASNFNQESVYKLIQEGFSTVDKPLVSDNAKIKFLDFYKNTKLQRFCGFVSSIKLYFFKNSEFFVFFVDFINFKNVNLSKIYKFFL